MKLTPPSTVAIPTTGAEVGVFGGQRSRLHLVDGVCSGILRRDGGTALALANKRALVGGQRASQRDLVAGRLTVASGSYSFDSFWRCAYSSSEGM
jgi:hypothetical protein